MGWARLDAFCLVPLSLRSAWRRRVLPNLNQKVDNATLKNYSELISLFLFERNPDTSDVTRRLEEEFHEQHEYKANDLEGKRENMLGGVVL